MDKVSGYIEKGNIFKLRQLCKSGALTSEKIKEALTANPPKNYLAEALEYKQLTIMQWFAKKFPEETKSMLKLNDFKVFKDVVETVGMDQELREIYKWLFKKFRTEAVEMYSATLGAGKRVAFSKALTSAAAAGDTTTMKWLKKSFLKQRLSTNSLYNPLRAASYAGHVGVMKWFVKNFPDQTEELISSSSYDVFRDAAYSGSIESLTYLAEKFPNELGEAIQHGGVLYEAFEKNHLDFIEHLSSLKTLSKDALKEVFTRVHHVIQDKAKKGNADIVEWGVKILLNLSQDEVNKYFTVSPMEMPSFTFLGKDFTHVNDYTTNRPFYKEIAEAMITAGADINLKNSLGQTLLIQVAREGHTGIVQFLIDAGADVNAQDNNGDTALSLAVSLGHTEIVQALINAGADANLGSRGTTPLMRAAADGHTEIVQPLIDAGADPNKPLEDGNTALMRAAADGHTEIVQALINAGADPNKPLEDGNTALMRAAAEGYKEIVQALIDAGANINVQDNNGNTALMQAARMGHTAIVRVFLNAGASSRPLGFGGRFYYSLSIAQASLLQFGRYIGRKLGLLTNHERELCSAIKGGDLAKVKRLIDTGSINVNHLPQEKMSALEFAIKKAAEASAQCLACLSFNSPDYEGVIREISQKSARWVVIKAINDCPEGSNRHKYISALRKDVSENPSNLDITTPPETLLSSQNQVKIPHNQSGNKTRPN